MQHVSAEIDRYTHFGVASSPFMSGMLFYCVLLIPTVTLVVLVRAVVDSSAKISASHCIVAASSYLVVTCLVFVVAAVLVARDPMKMLYARHERAVVVCNLTLAAYYIWFLCVLGAEASEHWDTRNVAQLTASAAVGLHYFVFAWRRIFTDKPPQLLASNYLMYATIFAFISYDRCMRINPRWIIDSPMFKFARSGRRPAVVPDADLRPQSL